MRRIVISLSDVLYAELEAAAANTRELGYCAERWAQEVIEADLASRRLPRIRLSMVAEALERNPVAMESIYE